MQWHVRKGCNAFHPHYVLKKYIQKKVIELVDMWITDSQKTNQDRWKKDSEKGILNIAI